MKKLITTAIFVLSSAFMFAAEPVKLFNGKDLSGWKIHGTEKWYVEKGEMVCESGADRSYGYLATTKAYKNFIMTLEFMPVEDGNSGVFVRSSLEGTKIKGWQVEIAPRFTGGIYETGGRKWISRPDAQESAKLLKKGEWNKMKIEVNGDTVKSWLNGVQMTDLKDEIFGKGEGVIALQIHGVRPNAPIVKLRWRNIEIQELP